MELSIIIINWNSFDFLIKCIRSIYETRNKVKYEIIVFDNASTEREIENLHEYYKDVRLILNDSNEGFARGNNIANKYASGDVVLFLNPDTVIQDDVLDEIYNLIVKNKKSIGIVGPKILNIDGSTQKDAARFLPTLGSMFCNIFLLKRLFNNVNFFSEYITNYEQSQEVEFISGACMAIRKNLFNRLGGFSEDYFMYSEDVDICNRTIEMGLKNYYLASHAIFHVGGTSSKKTLNSKLFECWLYKSRKVYFKKKGFFSVSVLNIIYIIGSSFRIIVTCMILLGSLIFRHDKEKINDYKLLILKYLKILLLGCNFDSIEINKKI